MISYIIQIQVADNGIEWGKWRDMSPDGKDTLYEAIRHLDAFREFMSKPTPDDSPFPTSLFKALIADMCKDGIKARARIVKRTYADEIVDPAERIKVYT